MQIPKLAIKTLDVLICFALLLWFNNIIESSKYCYIIWQCSGIFGFDYKQRTDIALYHFQLKKRLISRSTILKVAFHFSNKLTSNISEIQLRASNVWVTSIVLLYFCLVLLLTLDNNQNRNVTPYIIQWSLAIGFDQISMLREIHLVIRETLQQLSKPSGGNRLKDLFLDEVMFYKWLVGTSILWKASVLDYANHRKYVWY